MANGALLWRPAGMGGLRQQQAAGMRECNQAWSAHGTRGRHSPPHCQGQAAPPLGHAQPSLALMPGSTMGTQRWSFLCSCSTKRCRRREVGMPGGREVGMPGRRVMGMPGRRDVGMPGRREVGMPGRRRIHERPGRDMAFCAQGACHGHTPCTSCTHNQRNNHPWPDRKPPE